MKNLLFITTTNLSTNPRLLKELKLAQGNGYKCTYIAFQLGNWSDKTEQEHLKGINCNSYYISAIKKPFFNWIVSTIVWKLCSHLGGIFKNSLWVNAYAHNKRSWLINQTLIKLQNNFDLVIAHNLGALYPAYQYAKKHHIPFAFDIEDYHPGEKCSAPEKKRREFLMQKILPHAAYVSYASPLIGEHSLNLMERSLTKGTVQVPPPSRRGQEVRLINNSFPGAEFLFKTTESPKIQFVWFSQNITWGRGLELIVPALLKYKEKVHLNLIGNKRTDFYNQFLADFDEFITYIEPLSQNELHLSLSDYDIGLAIEVSNIDLNKDIALSNKIFAYAQSGIFILATDTLAQKQFIEEQNKDFGSAQSPVFDSTQTRIEIGMLSAQSIEAMEMAVSRIIDEVEIIRSNKTARFEYAKRLAWENESQKLLNIWDQLL